MCKKHEGPKKTSEESSDKTVFDKASYLKVLQRYEFSFLTLKDATLRMKSIE